MRKIEVNRIYKHFKGDLYLVEGIGLFSETGEKCVIYRELYGKNKLWVRPYDSFISGVDYEKYPDAHQKYRFELKKIEKVNKS